MPMRDKAWRPCGNEVVISVGVSVDFLSTCAALHNFVAHDIACIEIGCEVH